MSGGILGHMIADGEAAIEAVVGAPISAASLPSGAQITIDGLNAVVALVKSVPLANLEALIANARNLSNDADVAVFLLRELSQINVPYAGDAALAIEILKWIFINNTATTIGIPMTPEHRGR